MSFWSTSPGPHWSDFFWSYFSCSGTPIAQPIRRERLPLPDKGIYTFHLAKPIDAEAITKFLQAHFQITQQSHCALPTERLVRGLQTNWIVVYATINHEIVGTIVSRSLGTTTFHTLMNSEPKLSSYPNTSYVDFFCVHTDHRRGGLGSALLHHIVYFTLERGRFIHFFQKEISPLSSIPPLWCGRYITREVLQGRTANANIQESHFQKKQVTSTQSTDFRISTHSNEASLDSKVLIYDCGNFKVSLVITNTYHTVMNSWLAEVLYYHVQSENSVSPKNIASAIEEILESSGYRYILMDESIPHLKQMNWERDAAYYVYCYNLNPRHFLNTRPEFWL